ncbi:hypothetical protein STRNTR1_0453 [Stenotrophomonas maltophilia]|nr:hypothetical protein STRNTR1_0453 [Stenotrophomonas maltophilia]
MVGTAPSTHGVDLLINGSAGRWPALPSRDTERYAIASYSHQ